MLVKSAPGLLTPKEGKPREYVTDAEPGEEVPETTYYTRLVNDGSLVVVNTAQISAKKTGGK